MKTTKEAITTVDLLAVIALQLNVDEGTLRLEAYLADIKGWDSMAVLLLMAELDEQLGITLSQDTLKNLKTVQDIVNVVKDANLLLE
jgi:acyl carrier protein